MTITNDHALALIALERARAEGNRYTITQARIDVAKHEGAARRAALTPEQRAKVIMVTEGVGTLLQHTHVGPENKKGRQLMFIEPEFIHLTFKDNT